MTHKTLLAVTGAVSLLFVVSALMASASATPSMSELAAPYRAIPSQATSTSCSPHTLAPTCSSSASADRHDGILAVAAATDSGLDGQLPGDADSGATAELAPIVAMGDATAVTYTFHVDVTEARVADTGAGSGDLVLWANAGCDQCGDLAAQYDELSGPGSQTIAVTLLRGADDGSAGVVLGLTGDAAVDCDNVCVLEPAGTSAVSGRAVVTSIDVESWGLGRPVPPTITTPSQDATAHPSTYFPNCDAGCNSVTGEQVSGTAEPGMPIVLADAAGVLARVTTDDSGVWTADVSLPAGAQTVVATAVGPSAEASSAPRQFSVAAA